MKCPKCKSEQGESAYCSKCGVQLNKGCPNCKEVNGVDAVFCIKCGTKLEEMIVVKEVGKLDSSETVVEDSQQSKGSRREKSYKAASFSFAIITGVFLILFFSVLFFSWRVMPLSYVGRPFNLYELIRDIINSLSATGSAAFEHSMGLSGIFTIIGAIAGCAITITAAVLYLVKLCSQKMTLKENLKIMTPYIVSVWFISVICGFDGFSTVIPYVLGAMLLAAMGIIEFLLGGKKRNTAEKVCGSIMLGLGALVIFTTPIILDGYGGIMEAFLQGFYGMITDIKISAEAYYGLFFGGGFAIAAMILGMLALMKLYKKPGETLIGTAICGFTSIGLTLMAIILVTSLSSPYFQVVYGGCIAYIFFVVPIAVLAVVTSVLKTSQAN